MATDPSTNTHIDFNWLFLVESVTIAIVIIFYLFYFNRVLGWVVAALCNLYFRKYNYNASVEFEAIQLSLLAGRVLFKNARYHSINQSLRIVKGHITCRYWYFRTQGMESDPSREDNPDSSSTLPHRWIVAFEGAEWFVYNRTAAFDVILEHLGFVNPEDPSSDSSSQKQASHSPIERRMGLNNSQTTFKVQPPGSVNTSHHPNGKKQEKDEESMMSWALRDALPVKIEGRLGAVMIGNPSTSSILVFTFQHTHGVYSAPNARSRHDFFRQDFKFAFLQPKIVLRTNPDFSRTLKEHGAAVLNDLQSDPNFRQNFDQPIYHFLNSASFAQFGKYFSAKNSGVFNWINPHHQTKVNKIPGVALEADSFAGLPRFVQTNTQAHPVEYAKVTTILIARIMNFRYYLDSPGKVPADPLTVHQLSTSLSSDTEDGLPPEYGIDIRLVDANITYGPWADRQRAVIHRAIFPPQRFDNAEIPQPSAPGEQRAHSELLVKVDLENCQLRVPIRESSKDWQWLSDSAAAKQDYPNIRPYGWLDLSFGPGSEITLTQSQIPQKEGYEMVLQLRMIDLEARSSVNEKLFAKIPMVLIIADMPTPLAWDSPRTWKYRLALSAKSYHPHEFADSKNQPRVYLIRDHVQFVIDLVKDWLSGPPTPYEEWVPTTYEIQLKLVDYELFLNLNDLNIIENFDFMVGSNDNTSLLLCGQSLTIQVNIPGDLYRPPVSTTSFSVQFEDLNVKINYPAWSTQHSFATESALSCAELGRVTVHGTYDANDLVKPEAVDFLNLCLKMDDVLFKAFGHLFRLMLNIKENYIGSYRHYSTQEGFIAGFKKGIIGEHPDEVSYQAANSNTFEMDLQATITNLLLAFPQDSFDCKEVVFCAIPTLECFLKNHTSFMDMTLETSPLRFQPANDWEHLLDNPSTRQQILRGDFSSFQSQTRVRLESIRLTALRLFGPLPKAITYFGDWRCSIGQLTGEVAISDVEAFGRFARVLGENFADKANSIFADFPLPVEPDVTFARMSTESIDLILVAPRSRVRFYLSSGIKMSFNDLASDLFKIHTNVVLPAFGVYLLVPDPRGDMYNPAIPWLEVASCTGNLEVSFATADLGWEEKAQSQREFLEDQDFQTKRCHFLYPQNTNAPVPYPHLPNASRDILDDLERSPIHDPHAVIDCSDDGHSLRSYVTNAQGFDSSAEQSETDGRVAAKNLRRERLLYQRRLSVSAPRILRQDTSPIQATPYATALPSWRYYGLNPDTPPQQPTFLSMRAGLFPPQSIHYQPGDCEHTPFYTPRNKSGNEAPSQRTQVLGRKYLDLRMKTPLDLFVTPLCVEVIDDMLQTLKDNSEADGPSFYNRMLGSLDANPSRDTSTSGHHVLEFFISIPLVRFRLLQDIAAAFEPAGISSGSLNAPPLSTIALQLQQVCLVGKSPGLFSKGPWDELSLPQNVQASISGFQFLIRQDPRSSTNHFFLVLPPHSETTAGAVLIFQSGPADMHLAHDGHQLESVANSSDVTCSFVERAAETLAGSFASLLTHASRAVGIISEYGHHKKETLRRAVYRLVENDLDSTPSCLQRSPFWIHISPSSYRSRFAWYCSIRLRQSAHSLANRKAPVHHESNVSNVTELVIKNKLIAWTLDHDGDSDIGSLDVVLPRIGPILKPASSVPFESYLLENHSFLLRTGCFVVRFIHKVNSPTFASQAQNFENFFQVAPTTLLVATELRNNRVALGCYLNTGKITCEVDPQFSSLTQHIVTLVHAFKPKTSDGPLVRQECPDPVVISTKSDDASSLMRIFSTIELSVAFGGARLQAAVHQLGAMIEVGKLSFSFRLQDPTPSISCLSTIYFSSAHLEGIGIYLSEISPAHLSPRTEPVSECLLMSAKIENITVNARIQPDSSQLSPNVKLAISLGSLHVSVGRSLVKMEEFVRDWRRREVASRIVPMYHRILEAWKAEPVAQSTSNAVWNWSLCLEFHLAVISANFQPLPRLEVIYNLQGLNITDLRAPLKNGQIFLSGGIAVDQHTLSFTSTSENVDSEPSDMTQRHRGLLKFPSMQMLFSYSSPINPSIYLDISIDLFSAHLSINWLDTILTMTARYGEDINELIHLLRPPPVSPLSAKTESPKSAKPGEPSLQIFAEIVLSGFELSIVAPKPLPRIECRRVKGTVHPKFRHLELTDCAISLAPLEQTTGSMQSFARFVFDLFLSNQTPTWAFAHNNDHDPTPEDAVEITADFQRIHAVAATSAFKLLLDCIQHLQLELARIKTVHRTEMAEAESHIEQAWSSAQSQSSSEPLLKRLIFAGRCSQFGLAIPLDDPPSDSSQPPDATGPPQGFKGAALFISFTQLVTWSRLGQTAQASVELFAIQSLSQLDPSLVEHFESSSHETRNSIFVPHLDVKFGLTARHQAPTLLAVKASAPSGITIDMSPSILLIIHAFLDVYERDCHLIVNLLENHNQTSDVETTHQEQRSLTPKISLSPTITDPWAIRVDFDTGVGGGGKIQLHTFDLAQDDADFIEIFQRANVSLGRVNVDVAHSDLFFLPGVSAWAVYNPLSPTSDAALHLDIVVHSSQNTLNPTLLRFVSQMSAAAKQRVHPKPDHATAKPTPLKPPTQSTETTKSSILSTNLSFGLRIDRSELTITCLPTRALAKLQWASGVLFASGRLDKNQFNAACTISKIVAFLRHEHGFDSALKAEAGDMVASLDWRALRPATPQHTHTCSVLLKFSELLTEVDFNHLNIFLLFKAIWLDQVTPPTQSKRDQDVRKSPQPLEAIPQNDTTILLVAVLADNIKFLLRLSASVGTLHLGTTPLNLRVRHIPSVSRSLVLDVGETTCVAVGDGLLGGRAHLQHFTLRISVEDLSSDTILDINATIGPMEVYFTVSSETILLLRTDLIQGTVQDDWKDIKSQNENTSENAHGRKDLRLQTSLHLRSINVLATLYTASRGKSVLDAIENQINQQNTQAEDVLSQLPPGMIVRREKDTLLNVAQRLENERSSPPTHSVNEIKIVSSLQLTTHKISLVLFAGQFGDMPLLRMQLEATQASLTRTPTTTHMLYDLNFTTAGCQVARLNLAPNGLSEKIQSDGSWYGVLEKVPYESVLNANRLWISMSASEALEKNQVSHTFRAEMPNNIHISTDVTTHANLWSKFRSAWNKANQVKGTNEPFMDQDLAPTHVNEDLVLIAETPPVIEDAKVQELWHATLPLVNYFKWNENLPKYTLIRVIKPLDNVIDFFESVYESTFARHQCKNSSV